MSNISGKLPDFIKFEGVPADSDVLTIVDFDEDQSKFITMSVFLSEIQAGRGVGKTEATNMITEQYIKWYLNDDCITAGNHATAGNTGGDSRDHLAVECR